MSERERAMELTMPLTAIEIAELSTAAREGLSPAGRVFLRRALFELDRLRALAAEPPAEPSTMQFVEYYDRVVKDEPSITRFDAARKCWYASAGRQIFAEPPAAPGPDVREIENILEAYSERSIGMDAARGQLAVLFGKERGA